MKKKLLIISFFQSLLFLAGGVYAQSADYQEPDAAVLAGIGIVLVLYFAIIVFLIIALWKIFQKAGKPGWASIIPIYNLIILLEIVGKPTWWIVLLLIPIVNIFFAIKVTHLLSLSFGKGVGFTVGLLLLGIVFYPILAFGDATYEGPAGLAELAPEV